MYNPELNLLLESKIQELRQNLIRSNEELGADHPATKLLSVLQKCMDKLIQMKNDIDNCFDVEVREQLICVLSKDADKLKNLLISFMERS